MIIHTYIGKSKEKKKPGWQKQKAEYDAWLKSHGVDPNKKQTKKTFVAYQPKQEPYRRETPQYPSLNSFAGNTTKSEKKVYTGDKLLGIGTLHKSNAVPIFSKEEAQDQASMRR